MRRANRLLVIGAETYYGREAMRGIHGFCQNHGEWEFHPEEDNSPEAVRGARMAMREWKADGVIAHIRSSRMERLLRESRLPVVNISGARERTFPTVKTDSGAVGVMCAEYFLNCGFKHFGFCAITSELYSHERYEGYRRTLAQSGFGCSVLIDKALTRVVSSWVSNRRRTDRWLMSLKKPVAVMCLYDLRAQEVVGSCRRLGLRVPDDVAIVGASNEESRCQMCTPPLSSVDTDIQRIGYEAAQLLHRLLKGGKPLEGPILVPPRCIVTRQSSDVIALEDTDIGGLMRFIRQHAGEPISVKDLLREVPISRRVMEQRFLKLVGRTPKAEIMRVRMGLARRFLEETQWPITRVAERSGFMSQESFSRCFHREQGLCPKEYRLKYRIGERVGAVGHS